MKPSQILIAAKKLIRTPERWCQRKSYIKRGRYNAYCMFGAVNKVSQTHGPSGSVLLASGMAWKIMSDMVLISVAHFNDTHTHTEVMEFMDQAIAIAKDKENEKQNKA